jgi:hypothetical protein
MRKRTPRGRGRLPGKHHSSKDFRLLQYLALVSMKYEISSRDFSDSLIEAWKRQESTCGSLSIECRKQTRDSVILLITNNRKVVAQFSIPKHILEENNPLEEFTHRLSVFSSRDQIKSLSDLKHLRPTRAHMGC